MSTFEQAVETARYYQNMHGQPEAYVIHDVPEWGPNGGHYTPGHRVFSATPQAPGGILPPSSNRPGVHVATIEIDGSVTHVTERAT